MIYTYKCKVCGNIFDWMNDVEHRNMAICPLCRGDSYRDMKTELKNKSNFAALMEGRERWSESMGCLPEEIPARLKRFPGSVYDPEGRLLIKNRQHKLYEMRRRGVIEYS